MAINWIFAPDCGTMAKLGMVQYVLNQIRQAGYANEQIISS